MAVYDALGGELLHLFRANAADREVTSLAVRESGGGVLVVAGCEHGSQAIRVIELAQFGSGKARPKPALLANHDTFHPVASLALSPMRKRRCAKQQNRACFGTFLLQSSSGKDGSAVAENVLPRLLWEKILGSVPPIASALVLIGS